MRRPEAIKVGLQRLAMRGTEAAEAHAPRPHMGPVPVPPEPIRGYRGLPASAPIRIVRPVAADPEATVQAGAAVPEISIAVREGHTVAPVLREATVLPRDPRGHTGVRVAEAAVRPEVSGVLAEAVRPEACGAAVGAVAPQEVVPEGVVPAEGPEDADDSINSRFKNRKNPSQ